MRAEKTQKTRSSAPQIDKVRENRVRRAAERRGLRLSKTRRYDPGALDYGTYRLLEPGQRRGETFPSLDAVEAFLKHQDAERRKKAS